MIDRCFFPSFLSSLATVLRDYRINYGGFLSYNVLYHVPESDNATNKLSNSQTNLITPLRIRHARVQPQKSFVFARVADVFHNFM